MQFIQSGLKRTLAVLFLTAGTVMSAHANISQFVAKTYTEALGRAPESSAWSANVAYLNANGCNKNALKAVTKGVYLSAEYSNLNYDNYSKVLTLYRGIFNREPDAGGLANWVTYLNNGNSLSSLIDVLFQYVDGGEISSAAICGTLGYGWDTHPVLGNSAMPVIGSGISDLATLQSALGSASPGSTVYLAQRAVIFANSQIVIPAGVTLATAGTPNRTQYANQARIVRNAMFSAASDMDTAALIKLQPGARLASVWVTGQRQIFSFSAPQVNIFINTGYGSSVVNSRNENSAGWTAIAANRMNQSCSGVAIQGNLITGYSNTHVASSIANTDGISGNCEGMSITGNEIVDPSDVGVILFASGTAVGAGSPATQTSQVSGNTVISAGVPSYGAFAMDGLKIDSAFNFGSVSFAGASISNNQFWAGSDSHFDFGLAVGTMPWYPTGTGNIGTDGSFTYNTTAGITTPMQIGIAIDGMLNATVQGNSLTATAPSGAFTFRCTPAASNVADLYVSSPHASGSNMQGPPSNVNASLHNCAGH